MSSKKHKPIHKIHATVCVPPIKEEDNLTINATAPEDHHE